MSSSSSRIYLDNAATSWPKPDAVYNAVDFYQRHIGAPAGRSGYAEAGQASQGVESARFEVARLLSVRDAARIVLTTGGTDSLNLAIHGCLHPGDHVVTTTIEHNSVLRPLRMQQEQRGVSVTRVACDATGRVDAAAIRAALRPETRLVVVSHASNVTGAIQPIGDIAAVARQNGSLVVVDAAQTFGHVPIDVSDLQIDLLASSGHKGLLGPLGTGILYIRPGLEEHLVSQRQGGTGTQSDVDRQPGSLPGKFEAGSLNVPGFHGLGAAGLYLRSRGVESVRNHSEQLTARLLAGLVGIRGVRIYGPSSESDRVGLVSISVEGYDPQEVAATLDASYRIQVRPGFHCAPLMHESLGTAGSGGTVRLSLGVFNTASEIDAAVAAIAEISAAEISFS